jgi:probable HAF family extracellular repeat protein
VGHVVGEGYNAEGDLHPFLWTPQSGIQDLGTLGYKSESRALAINDLGWVVGESLTVDLENHAFLWTPRHGMRDLGTLGGSESEAEGINNLGQVVGGSYTDTGDFHAFLSTDKGKMADLGTLGGAFSTAFDINDLGHVVGWSSTSSGEGHAFLWTPEGGMQDLGALDGVSSAAICINDLDHIAGIRWLTTGGTLQTRGFLLTPTEGMRDLGPLPGHQNSEVVDINNEGQVVGWSAEGTNQRHVVLWTVPPPPSGPEPRDPEDRLAALISEIAELVDKGVLNKGQGNALIQKLQNALRMLLQEKSPATCGQLQAFINQVEAYTKTGVLPEDIGLELIYTANSVIVEVCG